MAGHVKPPDRVRHKTGAAGAKVVVIWVPGEEGRRVASRWKREPERPGAVGAAIPYKI